MAARLLGSRRVLIPSSDQGIYIFIFLSRQWILKHICLFFFRFQSTNYNSQNEPQNRHHHRNERGFAPPNANQPPARSRELFCETCDRDFRSVDQLAEHRQQHQRCGIDGCLFEAHEAMVSKHIQQQHSSGLYDKIKNLTSPEEIAKWREERRKRFPTKQNMVMRQQIQEAKQKRGERLEDSKSRFGQKGDRRTGAGGGAPAAGAAKRDASADGAPSKKRRRKRKPAGNQERKEKQDALQDASVGKEVVTNGSLIMFGGTDSMKNYKRPREAQTNALSGLLGAYGSDDSESSEEDVPTTIVIDMPAVESPEIVGLVPETIREQSAPTEHLAEPEIPIDANDEDAPEEASVQRVSDLPDIDDQPIVARPPPQQKKSRPAHEEHRAPRKPPKPTASLDLSRRYRNQNTMLEKLLQKDIRHERNVLLQCVRYVVDNQFFGIGQPKVEDAEKKCK